MTNFQGGTAVRRGYYLNLSRWAIQPVSRDGERLPEIRGEWIAIPTVAALALTPVLGAAFLVFMPLIGFLLALHALTAPLVRALRSSAQDLAATVRPGWQPGEAHFTGAAPAGGAPGGAATRDAALDALEREIARRRAA